MCKRYALMALIPAFCAIMVFGGQTKKIVIGDFKDFQEGTLRGTSVDNRGRLFIGPRIQSITGPDREYYLSVAAGPKGGLLLGTGHGASVFQIPPGKDAAKKIFEVDQLDVYGLAVTPSGTIFVGTSPNGSVYRISGKGKVDKVFTPREKFIWALEADNRGRIYCAVGNHGAVYRLEDKEKAGPVKLFDAEDAHITSLYSAKDGAVYAGSADRGILYRISDHKVRVMFDSPFEEIRGISEDDRGRIYFAATRRVRRASEKKEALTGKQADRKERDEREVMDREMSALYRLNSDNSVERIWESMKETVYDLCYRAGGNAVYLGTGDTGRIYRVEEDGDYSLVTETPSAQVFKMIPYSRGVAAITNNTAGIWHVEASNAGKGEYLSRIYDLMVPSRFGRISWRTENGSSGVAAVFVRTGNSRLPDKTWTPWSPPFTDPANARMEARGYRYIQFKVGLNSANLPRSPQFTRLTAYYLQNNLRPRIRWLKTRPWRENETKKEDGKSKGPELLVHWKAEDPNSDKLQAAVELRRVGSDTWVPFKQHIFGDRLGIDPRMVADGEYQLRLKVDDALSNPPDDALTVTQLSRIFTIDSTAPAIEEPEVRNGNLHFRIVDATSPVRSVTFSTDGKLWLPISPVDGLMDSGAESFRLSLSRMRGNRLVYVRYSDEYDNFKIYQHQIRN